MKNRSQYGKVLVTALSLFLAFFMTVEVAHSHDSGAADNAAIHCQFCATAHVAIASAPAWLTGYVLHLIGQVSIGETQPGTRPVVRTAFIRPPPHPVEASLL